MNILHIDASASDGSTSHTRRLTRELVEKLKAANPGAAVVYRDVVANQLPHVDMTIREAWTSEDAALAATLKRSKELVAELQADDVVVVGSPMYNFTVPSMLKAWIDHVSIAGTIEPRLPSPWRWPWLGLALAAAGGAEHQNC